MERIAEIRKRIHEIYKAENPIAHEAELMSLHEELRELLAERPEVVAP